MPMPQRRYARDRHTHEYLYLAPSERELVRRVIQANPKKRYFVGFFDGNRLVTFRVGIPIAVFDERIAHTREGWLALIKASEETDRINRRYT